MTVSIVVSCPRIGKMNKEKKFVNDISYVNGRRKKISLHSKKRQYIIYPLSNLWDY